ncbi:hypothetical protein KY333_00015 [Candidatus Woesearchaeota archaeon]|nr:hypothetical protein [Candidatus Woesearchaeota archaeon]
MKKPGIIKTTLTGLLLTALATLSSCVEKETEYVDVHHWQTPVADIEAISDDGDFTALEVREKDDWEVYVFNMQTGTATNISNDPINSDKTVGFAGHHLITLSENPQDIENIKIYDVETGLLTFESDAYSWIGQEIIPYGAGTKVLMNLDDGTGANIFTHTLGENTLEKLITGSAYSYIEKASEDKSLIFIEHDSPSGPTMSIFRPADGSITPVLNLSNHDVRHISKNNKTAVMVNWNYPNSDLKTLDIDTNTVNLVNLPTGKRYDFVYDISENGETAMVMLQDTATDNREWYCLDTATQTLDFITDAEVGAAIYDPQSISADGTITAFRDWSSPEIRLFNADTDEFYDPFNAITHTGSSILGFTSDGKAVLDYSTNVGWYGISNLVLHDPATKTNTPIEDSNFSNRWTAEMLPGNQHLARDAEEIATGWEVVILEDLLNATKKIIQLPGLDANYVDHSPDGSTVYIESRSNMPNLFAYDLATEAVTQITNNTDESVNGFRIEKHSADGQSLIFREYNWNGTETYKQLDFDTGDIKIVAYED